jgi:hypothetical protein
MSFVLGFMRQLGVTVGLLGLIACSVCSQPNIAAGRLVHGIGRALTAARKKGKAREDKEGQAR